MPHPNGEEYSHEWYQCAPNGQADLPKRIRALYEEYHHRMEYHMRHAALIHHEAVASTYAMVCGDLLQALCKGGEA